MLQSTPAPTLSHSHSHVTITATVPPTMPVDVADDINVVSGVGVSDVSSDTANAASPLATSIQHPIATIATAVKSFDAPPRPWPVTVDLITQDASQLSCTGDDDACELACERVLEETAGEEKGDRVGGPVGEGVAGNGPRRTSRCASGRAVSAASAPLLRWTGRLGKSQRIG